VAARHPAVKRLAIALVLVFVSCGDKLPLHLSAQRLEKLQSKHPWHVAFESSAPRDELMSHYRKWLKERDCKVDEERREVITPMKNPPPVEGGHSRLTSVPRLADHMLSSDCRKTKYEIRYYPPTGDALAIIDLKSWAH
jgi:hypothetical protein